MFKTRPEIARLDVQTRAVAVLLLIDPELVDHREQQVRHRCGAQTGRGGRFRAAVTHHRQDHRHRIMIVLVAVLMLLPYSTIE